MWQLIAKFFAFFVKAVADARLKGRQDVIDEAHLEADERKADAKAIDDNWRGLSTDERERVRESEKHYRD